MPAGFPPGQGPKVPNATSDRLDRLGGAEELTPERGSGARSFALFSLLLAPSYRLPACFAPFFF